MRVALVLAVLIAASSATAITPTIPAAEVRERSAALARAQSARDVNAALAFWTPTAVVHFEGTPALRGRAEIAKMYGPLFETLVTFWLEPHEVRVAESGELAYEIGTSHLMRRETGPQKIGIAQTTSKYLAIWTLGKDRVWRIDALSLTGNPATP